MKIEITIGDITDQPDLDAVVNAAKPELTGGGGVDGAVHRAAGPELLAHCLTLPGMLAVDPTIRCPRGHAVVTPAFDMPNEFIVHTAGPIYKDVGEAEAAKYLHACYRNCIVQGYHAGARSIGFPAIGTGIYGYPLQAATIVLMDTLFNDQVLRSGKFDDLTVRFVCFDVANYMVYRDVFNQFQTGFGMSAII